MAILEYYAPVFATRSSLAENLVLVVHNDTGGGMDRQLVLGLIQSLGYLLE